MQSYTFTNRKLIENKKNNGVRILLVVTMILTFITIFVQLFVMSEYATKGDEIARLEQRKEQLSKENLQLKKEIAEARNLNYIQEKAREMGYVAFKSSDVKYVKLD